MEVDNINTNEVIEFPDTNYPNEVQGSSKTLLDLFANIDMTTTVQIHEFKKLSETNDCHPFKCSPTILFWYTMKTLHFLGENEINLIFKFLHSTEFNLNDTPKSYKDLENMEPKIVTSGNVM